MDERKYTEEGTGEGKYIVGRYAKITSGSIKPGGIIKQVWIDDSKGIFQLTLDNGWGYHPREEDVLISEIRE